MKNKVNVNKTLFKGFKNLFFVAALLFLYFKVFKDKSASDVFQFYASSMSLSLLGYVILAFILMFANWGLEAQKWRIILRESYKLTFIDSLRAVFSGNSTGIFTPNRLGAFIGRVLHLPEGVRAEGTVTTWVGNAAQLVATLIFGTVGAFFYWMDDTYTWNFNTDLSLLKNTLFYFSLIITLIALIGYFLAGYFINWFSNWPFLRSMLDNLEKVNSFSNSQLAYYLVLSILRYLVFIFQFYFLFKAFNVQLELKDVFVYIGVLYIIIAFMPTMFGKFGVRESVLLILLSHLPFTDLQIISTSFTLWLINTILPALLGSFFILNLKNKE